MSGIAIIVLVLAGIGLAVLSLPAVANFLVRRKLRPKTTVYGSNFVVGPNWTEMSGIKPQRKGFERQHVFLCVEGYEFDRNDDRLDIKLVDGRIVVPEVQVVDSSGNIFDTEDGARFGNTMGLSVLPIGENRLSSDKQQVVIRIRSEEPFQCRLIGWQTKRMK